MLMTKPQKQKSNEVCEKRRFLKIRTSLVALSRHVSARWPSIPVSRRAGYDYVEMASKKKPARTPFEETKPEFFKRKGMENGERTELVSFCDVEWSGWVGREGEGMVGDRKKR